MAEGYHDFTAGEVLTAANLEDYCQNQGILRFASSAARDSALSGVLTEGLMAYLKDVNTITVYTGSAWSTIGPVHGAATSYTPTVTQSGSVAISVNNSVYQRVGRWVHWRFVITCTGTGTGANDVTISLPTSAAYGGNDYSWCGMAGIYDASATLHYSGVAVLTSASLIKIRNGATSAAASYLGSSAFTAAITTNDIISGSISYEASTDG